MTCEIPHAILYSLVGVFILTWLGNQVCGLLLVWSGLFKARTAAAEADASTIKPVGAEDASKSAAAELRDIPTTAKPTQTELPRVGGLIGTFERMILAAAIIVSAWPILAAVVALKSVARFKELDKKLDAEYFLVGSLFSVAWAMVVTWLWIVYDQTVGMDLSTTIASSLAAK